LLGFVVLTSKLPQLAERAKNGTLAATRTSKGRRDMAGVKQARDGAVGILTLDEPASLNAMTPTCSARSLP
jgi:hypothetical protein